MSVVQDSAVRRFWVEIVLDDAVILIEQAGGQGDFDINAANGNPSSNVGTDDTAAINECLLYMENLFDAFDITPGSSTGNRHLAGGGEVRGRAGANYLVSDTVFYTPRVLLNLVGCSICADTNAAWTDQTGSIVNWIEVTNGGTGYTSAPTVNISGGAGTGAAATAYIDAGVVTHVYIESVGEGFTSAPTVGFTGGGGSGAAGTAELGVIGQPLVSSKQSSGAFTVWHGGVKGGFMWGRNVADCVSYPNIKGDQSRDVVVFEGKHTGFSFLAADRNDLWNMTAWACGKYNFYATGDWNGDETLPTQELRIHGGESLFGGRACVYTDTTTNSCTFLITARQSVGDSPVGSEFILACGNTGHSLAGAKIEHDGINPNPVIVTIGGAGFDLDFNAAPNSVSVHYKWVRNTSSNDVGISMWSAETVLSSRIDNPNKADDISPFESAAFGGINVYKTPFTSDNRLKFTSDWCRDMDGNDQGASLYNMLRYSGGWSNGLQTQRMDMDAPIAAEVTLRSGISGDDNETLRILGNGDLRWGDGSATPNTIRMGLSGSNLEIKYGSTTTGPVTGILTVTLAQLNDISDTVNILGKFENRQYKVSATDVIVYANTGAASGVWKDSQGVTIATPV